MTPLVTYKKYLLVFGEDFLISDLSRLSGLGLRYIFEGGGEWREKYGFEKGVMASPGPRVLREAYLQHIPEGCHKMRDDSIPDMLRQEVEIILVFSRQNNVFELCPDRCDDLFFQPADGHDKAAQGQFSGHNHVTAHCLSNCQGIKGTGHGNTRGWTILWCCSSRNMQVDKVLFEEVHRIGIVFQE